MHCRHHVPAMCLQYDKSGAALQAKSEHTESVTGVTFTQLIHSCTITIVLSYSVYAPPSYDHTSAQAQCGIQRTCVVNGTQCNEHALLRIVIHRRRPPGSNTSAQYGKAQRHGRVIADVQRELPAEAIVVILELMFLQRFRSSTSVTGMKRRVVAPRGNTACSFDQTL